MAELSPHNAVDETPDRAVLYDSTLRDGEQMPGVAFDVDDKVEIAEALDRAGVPEIEAGFPPVGDAERRAVDRVVDAGLEADVLALSRLRRDDIDLCRKLDVDLAMTFIASSKRHREVKYGMSRDEVLERIHDVLGYAADHGVDVSFSTEDSTRTERAFLRQVFEAADEHAVARIGIADTTGSAAPWAIRDLVADLDRRVDAPTSVHLHDDFGLATANALAGFRAGAEFAAVTVNGIGERGGNLPLEQTAAALERMLGVETGIDLSELTRVSRLVAEKAGIELEPHRPLVGDNAFAHESGIHVGAILEDPRTYEPVAPSWVGNERRFVLGKHTGTAHVEQLLDDLGVEAGEAEVEAILRRVKSAGIEDRVAEDRFRAIVDDVVG